MSTYYRPTKPIKLRHIKENLDLEEIGFQVIDDDEEDKHYFLCLLYTSDAADE